MYTKILLAILCAFVLWCIFITIDTAFLPKFESIGTVINKEYKKAHTTMVSTSQAGGGVSMSPVYHPAKFMAIVQAQNISDSVEVRGFVYNRLDKGDIVRVEYTIGRITGKTCLIGIIEK